MIRNAQNSSSQALFIQPHQSVRGFSMTTIQVGLLAGLLAFGVALIGLGLDTALIPTLLIFFFVVLVGLWLCDRTRRTLADSKLNILGTFWLIKVAATLFLLHAGWISQLDPDVSKSWGYDPQRYYQYSWDLVQNNWNPAWLEQNYQGIIFYYAAIFYLFGHNPVIPALLNAFVTLLGTLFLIRCAYSFAPRRTSKDWVIAALMLVPEVLWYDVMTSRETLMPILIIIAALAAGRYLMKVGRATVISTLLFIGTALVAILSVRTSMVIPVVASILVMTLMLKSHRTMKPLTKALLVALCVGALSGGPLIQHLTGGYRIDYLETLDRIQSFENNVAAGEDWSENSIGILLAPSNAWQSVVFLPPRMLLYLAAPLPNVAVSVTDLLGGSWSAWQRLMTIPTSIMMLLGFPYVLAGTAQAWRHRKQFPAPMIIPITFWITFAAVAGGNIIIHERYRLMFTLLLFACMWLGYTGSARRQVQHWAFLWFGFLAAAALFYMSYKFTG